jgi:hypothetical protein
MVQVTNPSSAATWWRALEAGGVSKACWHSNQLEYEGVL